MLKLLVLTQWSTAIHELYCDITPSSFLDNNVTKSLYEAETQAVSHAVSESEDETDGKG